MGLSLIIFDISPQSISHIQVVLRLILKVKLALWGLFLCFLRKILPFPPFGSGNLLQKITKTALLDPYSSQFHSDFCPIP